MKFYNTIRYQGFSLIELVIVLTITAIVVALGAQLIATGFRNYLYSQRANAANNEGLLAITRLSRDLATAQQLTVTGASLLQFLNQDSSTITYQLTGDDLLRNSRILAENISSVNFTYYDSNGFITAVPANIYFVRTQLTIATDGNTFTFQSTIHPRSIS
ncbi:MAG: hypothetical protein Tsb005_11130 [Gammaproteobacteria bacterium]